MEGQFLIWVSKDKLYVKGDSSNPGNFIRTFKSRLQNGTYENHKTYKPFHDSITKHGVSENLSWESHINGKATYKEKELIARGFVNIEDVRDPDKEYPKHYERILKKTAEMLETGLIDEDELDEFLDGV